MFKDSVRTPEDALAYIVDCTLATVSSMAMKKSRSKSAYNRQKDIAQLGVNWMKEMSVDLKGTRAEDMQNITVNEWAKKYENN